MTNHNIRAFLLRHYLSFIFAFIVGVFILLPQILLFVNLKSDYKGVHIMKTDAEEHYLARIREFYDGTNIGNPFLYEEKGESPSALFSISESVLAIPGKIFDISVASLDLLYKFVLPAIIYLLAYFLLFRLTGNISWSIAGSIVLVLGYTLFSVSGIMGLLNWDIKNPQYHMYARPVNPQFSSIVFLSYIHILLTALRNGSKKWFLFVSLMFGFSFYVYFYTFTFLMALNTFFIVLFYFIKQNRLSLQMTTATLVGVFLGLPRFLNLYNLTHHEYYKYLETISNVVKSREPVVSLAGALVLLFFVIYFIRAKKNIDDYFLAGLLLTTFVVVNQQILTGVLVQEGHYHWYLNTPVFIIVFFWLCWKYLHQKNKIFQYALISFVILVSFLRVGLTSYSFYSYWHDRVADEQRYVSIYNWLNQHTDPESVVLANNSISLLIPVFTANNVTWNHDALTYLSSRERMIYTLFLYLKLNNVSPDIIPSEDYFHPPVLRELPYKDSVMYDYIEPYIMLENYMANIYPRDMLVMYKKFWSDDIRENLARYRLDYIVWDTLNNPGWRFDQDEMNVVFSSNGINVYKYEH